MEIILRQKPMPIDGALRCACGAQLMETWAGSPVVTHDAESGAAMCRSCAYEQSPLMASLADLAGVVAVTRPSRGTEPILEAAARFRVPAIDAAQAGALAFALAHGIKKLNDD
jgi:hypothetical protein